MSQTTKPMSLLDFEQVIKGAYNESDKSLTTGSFLTAKVGHKIEVTYPSSSVEVYAFKDGTTMLYELTITYTSSTKDNLQSAERTA